MDYEIFATLQFLLQGTKAACPFIWRYRFRTLKDKY
jgi:hypothetical protein